MDSNTARTFPQLLDHLVEQSLLRDVSPEAAQSARAATERGLRLPSGPLSAAGTRRAEAYFTAVLRRQAVRRGQPARGAARFVVAAVVEDLRASGRDGKAIWDQLNRGWSDSVPQDVLEEYRLRLCG